MNAGPTAVPRSHDDVHVTLDRHGILDPAVRRWLAQVGADGLAPHAQCALAMVRRDEMLDDQVLRHQLGIDTLDARLLLARLVTDGWLVNPSRRGGSYGAGDGLQSDRAQPALLDVVGGRPGGVRGSADAAILGALDTENARNVHEIVERTGLSLNYVRLRLRVLVDQGQAQATAAPTSRRRGYVRTI